MGKKGNDKSSKKKMTKKEKKQLNHLKLVKTKKHQSDSTTEIEIYRLKKKAA